MANAGARAYNGGSGVHGPSSSGGQGLDAKMPWNDRVLCLKHLYINASATVLIESWIDGARRQVPVSFPSLHFRLLWKTEITDTWAGYTSTAHVYLIYN